MKKILEELRETNKKLEWLTVILGVFGTLIFFLLFYMACDLAFMRGYLCH